MEIKYWYVQRPRGKVLYATCATWKKPRYYDPGFNEWSKSQETQENVIHQGITANPPENVQKLLKTT